MINLCPIVYAESSCASSFSRLVSRAEYVLARKSDVWYFVALIIASVINAIMFFSATVDGRSSVWCSVQRDGDAPDPDVDCRAFSVFHWVSQVSTSLTQGHTA